MFRKRFATLFAVLSVLTGCTAPPVTNNTIRPSAQLGTVEPVYPVGTDLAPDIEVIEVVPVNELSNSEPIPFDADDSCASVPADVVTPAGLASTPELGNDFGCLWHGPGLGLQIGTLPYSMATEVEQHRDMSNGGSTDPLAHLAWLRIDGHYAIERILELDRTKSCWLSLDVSSSTIVHVALYRIDTTGEPAESDTDTSLRKLCPVTREIAKNLLDHLDDQQPGWWEVQPTG